MNALTPITAVTVRNNADTMVPKPIADDAWDDAWADPGWREAAAIDYREARGNRVSIAPYAPEEIARLRRLMDDYVSLDRAGAELSRSSGAAASTIEALMFPLRSRGVQALGEPDVLRRLAQLDNVQLREVATRLQPKPHMVSAWSPEDVQVLLTVRSKIDEQDA